MTQAEGALPPAYQRLKEEAIEKWKRFKKSPGPYALVGTATCGIAQGASDVVRALIEGAGSLGTSLEVKEVGCIGHCYAEPLVILRAHGNPPYLYGKVTPDRADLLLKRYLVEGDPFLPFVMGSLEQDELMPLVYDLPRFYFEKRLILALCGLIDPDDIYHYIANGGYEALARGISMEPESIIKMIEDSGLRGRGGAGFPTGRKWEACRNAQGDPRYVICNADEGDPGAYMDRAILESNPHQVIEGLVLAGRAIGASEGYIYLRAEYPLAIKRVRTAIAAAEEAGLLGDDILGCGFSFRLRLFEGSGAFVCGEETALIRSIEGKRGMPRHRPPYPAVEGFNGRPTAINNVKTLALATGIVKEGPEQFRSIGSAASKGTMVFSMVGKVMDPGLVEVPMGTTLRRLIFEICGGIPGNKAFKAVQIGGPSGGCLPEALLETEIDYEALSGAGAMMGSGGIVVMDEDDCMVEVPRFFLEFTQGESCGKCTFCRIGTKQMLMLLSDITAGRGSLEDLELLEELAEDIKMGSLCNLGRTAPNPVLTTLRYFRDEYEAHVLRRCCPAKQCRELTAFYITAERCAAGCDACVGTCPTEAVYAMKNRKKAIDQQKCVKCAECVKACPPEYDAVIRISPKEEVPPADQEPPESAGSQSTGEIGE